MVSSLLRFYVGMFLLQAVHKNPGLPEEQSAPWPSTSELRLIVRRLNCTQGLLVY